MREANDVTGGGCFRRKRPRERKHVNGGDGQHKTNLSASSLWKQDPYALTVTIEAGVRFSVPIKRASRWLWVPAFAGNDDPY